MWKEAGEGPVPINSTPIYCGGEGQGSWASASSAPTVLLCCPSLSAASRNHHPHNTSSSQTAPCSALSEPRAPSPLPLGPKIHLLSYPPPLENTRKARRHCSFEPREKFSHNGTLSRILPPSLCLCCAPLPRTPFLST